MKFYCILYLTILSLSSYSQDMKNYTGSWQGKIENKNTFNLIITIKKLTHGNTKFIISNERQIITKDFLLKNNILISLNDNLSFKGKMNEAETEINGFIKSGLLLYHIKLKKEGGIFKGNWDILMVDYFKSQSLYLSIENGSGNEYQAYPIFGDNRFTGTWCSNFKKKKDTIYFTDFKTGLQFKGVLKASEILLSINLGEKSIIQVSFVKTEDNWNIGNFSTNNHSKINDDWKIATNPLLLPKMENDIKAKVLDKTESVIIACNGEIIYEKYFSGFNGNIPHDMRSASKSISSAIVGIAIDQKLIKCEKEKLYKYLPTEYLITKDSLKSEITIKSLLTMSSGLDAIDFGSKSNIKSTAIEDNYQMTKDWTKSILNASMINKPFTHANYGSANPYLLGVVVNSVVKEPLELFIDQNLFLPLGISNYIIQTDMSGKPYFGGGMYLRPRDMLKFGQLYLNKGKWKNNQVLSKKWIKKSFKNYLNLENAPEKNDYGYLWWHHSYLIDGKEIKSIEARGAGGQYIFVIPKLNIVTVITSGNYRNKKGQQPEKILEKYILPILMEK